jgi:FKBP-type peptidyl-prolyl cis-trans isomerase FkpA/FKBP-type peptidyl-prolyl cis-trans isomerase FklB
MSAISNALRVAILCFAAIGWLACEQKPGASTGAQEGSAASDASELGTDDQKTIYAIGLALARELDPFDLTEAEIGTFEQGLRDGVLGRPPKVDLETQGPKIETFAKARLAAASGEETAASESFLATAAAAPGAQKLESGLVYLEVAPGTGASPKDSDTVSVHYHGTLRDGSVFDSSVERGTPAQFPLNRVIPCWTEGVQKMKVGGKGRLTCPASIAYGDRGAPPKIKPGAALAFDVELLEILPAAAGGLPAGHPPTGGSATAD